jgi:hypothetical protein
MNGALTDAASAGRPSCSEAIVAGDPLGRDVRVNLDGM